MPQRVTIHRSTFPKFLCSYLLELLCLPLPPFCHFLLLWLGKSQFLQHNQTFESWPKSFLKLFTDYPSHDWWAKRNIFVVVQELKYVEGSEFILQFGNYLTSKYFFRYSHGLEPKKHEVYFCLNSHYKYCCILDTENGRVWKKVTEN